MLIRRGWRRAAHAARRVRCRRRRAVRPRRHARRHRARSRRRAEPRARATRPAAGAARAAASATRRTARAACSARAWASRRSDRAATRRCATRSSRLRGGAVRRHRRCSTAWPRCSTRIEARGLRWGIVTNKATRFTAPLLEALRTRVARARASSAATPRRTPSRIRRRCCTRPRSSASRRRAASTSATPSATSCRHRGGHADDRRALRLHRAAATRRSTGRPTGSIDTPVDLLRWLPRTRAGCERAAGYSGTRPGVEEQPLARLAVARAGDAHRLARDQRLARPRPACRRSTPARCRWPARRDRRPSSRASRRSRSRRARRARPCAGASSAVQLSGCATMPVSSSAFRRYDRALEARGRRAARPRRRGAGRGDAPLAAARRGRPAAAAATRCRALRRRIADPDAVGSHRLERRAAGDLLAALRPAAAALRQAEQRVAVAVALGEDAEQRAVAGGRAAASARRCRRAARRRRARDRKAPPRRSPRPRRRSSRRRRRPRGAGRTSAIPSAR